MNNYPDSFHTNQEFVVRDQLTSIGQEGLAALQEKGYEVQLGFLESDVENLGGIINQPSIREYCPKDSTERFKDIQTTSEWLKKGRLAFFLKERSSGNIAGYAWSGPGTSEQIPDGTTTGAIRLNEDYQNIGLASPFLAVVISFTLQNFPGGTIWYETWQSNTGAVHIYKKIGFQFVDSVEANRQTANGETVLDRRIFLKLVP